MSTKCVGTFKTTDEANPYIGEKNNLEFVCDVKKVKEGISTLKKVHPYEEPAIDIIPLIDEDYISISDMLKSKDGDFFVSDWLRNRNTIGFLGT